MIPLDKCITRCFPVTPIFWLDINGIFLFVVTFCRCTNFFDSTQIPECKLRFPVRPLTSYRLNHDLEMGITFLANSIIALRLAGVNLKSTQLFHKYPAVSKIRLNIKPLQ